MLRIPQKMRRIRKKMPMRRPAKTENESSPENTAAKKDSEEPQPPPQPPRPLSEFQKSQLTLTELPVC